MTNSFVIKLYKYIAKYNFNNIMMQAKGLETTSKAPFFVSDYKGSFNFSRLIEKKLILEIAKFLKVNFSKLSGYFTTGGTESNIYSLWLARNWAEKIAKPNEKSFWLIPDSSHYSIFKALNILGILDNHRHKIKKINLNFNLSINSSEIINLIKNIRVSGDSPIIIVLTAVTTEFGLIDPIGEVVFFIKKNKIKNVFIHLDACFSGLILPLFKKYKTLFSHPEISTISIDFHKTFGSPIGSGLVLINNNFHIFAKIKAAYLADSDFTLTGSRSGINVIQVWALFKTRVSTGEWKREVIKSIQLTDILYQNLLTIDYIDIVYKPEINFFIFKIKNINKNRSKKIKKILYEFSISPTIYKDEEIFKIIVNNYITKKTIIDLVKKLKKQ